MHVWVLPRLHTHKMWAEVSSSAHLLHNGLSISTIMYMCLLRVLCQLRRPVTTLDCILLKDSSLVLVVGLQPNISFWVGLWVLVKLCHIAICWLSVHHFIFLIVICLENSKAHSGPTNWWTVPFLLSLSALSFPYVPECPTTQDSPTEWWVEMLFAFWHCCTNGDIVLAAWRAFKAAYQKNTNVFLWFEFCKLRPRWHIFQFGRLPLTFLERYWAFFP